MLKKTIVYTDYNGEERKEDYFFNLSQRELERWDLSTPGGLAEKFQRIIDKKDGKEIMDAFYELIARAYGEKTEDGRYFVKKKNGVELFELFEQSPAFDALYGELITDANAAANFFNGLIPANLAEEVKKNQNLIPG